MLAEAQRQELKELISTGTAPVRTLAHARILLKADQGPQGPGWQDAAIGAAVEVSRPTVERVRKRFTQEGLEAALHRRAPEREYSRKLDGRQEAHLIALACATPMEGQGRWTLRLLANRMVELEYVDSVSYETIRRTLKKTGLNPGWRNNGSSRPKLMESSYFAWRMSCRFILVPTTPVAPRCAWMKPAFSCWRKPALEHP